MSAEEKLDLNQLRNDIAQEVENEDHKKIARICRTVLASKPNELLWLRLLCCAMIHLSQTKPLLTLIETYVNKHQIYNALIFYKIYCLYLSKQNEQAQDVINKNTQIIENKLTKEEYLATQYIKYQLFYRLAQYKSALNTLKTLNNNNGYTTELIINEISTLIAMNEPAKAVHNYYNNTSLHNNCDFVFNLSIALILCSRINDAKQFLISSLSKCENAMKEQQYDSPEILSELANLQLLIAYCFYLQNDFETADKYYQQLNNTKIDSFYDNLILGNNYLINKNVDEKEEKDNHEKLYKLYGKLSCNKNTDNLLRIGVDKNGLNQVMKVYHNYCVILMKNQSKKNKLLFKQLISKIKSANPLSELGLFLKIGYFANNNQYQQCGDILLHHLSTHPKPSNKSQLYYIQILINKKKYKMAIKQLLSINNELKYTEKMINVMLNITQIKLNDNNLTIEIIKQCIEYLSKKNEQNNNLLISLEIKLCKLLISINCAAEAKIISQNLYKRDANNELYKAIFLLTCIHTNDMIGAQKTCQEIKINDDFDGFDMDDIPKPIAMDFDGFSFEINKEMEVKRKREINRRKREKNAIKLRKKFKENPALYKEAINWKSAKKSYEKKGGKKEINSKAKAKKKQKEKSKNKKKKKPYRGAQGGSGTSDKFQVYDIGDPKNKNKGKKQIPHHIKKKRKR